MGCQKWLCLCAPVFLTYFWQSRLCGYVLMLRFKISISDWAFKLKYNFKPHKLSKLLKKPSKIPIFWYSISKITWVLDLTCTLFFFQFAHYLSAPLTNFDKRYENNYMFQSAQVKNVLRVECPHWKSWINELLILYV